jgi:hypothetical protein
MAHHRNFAIDQGAHRFDTFGTALQFDRRRATLQESAGIAKRFLDTKVKAEKWHIGDEQGARPSANNRFQMMVHHRHTDRQRIVESKANVADTVTDQDDIDDGIRDACCNCIIGGGHYEPPPLPLPALQHWNGDTFNRRFGNVTHFGSPIS